jgi:integrase
LNFAIAESDPDGTVGLVNPFVALTRRKLWRKLTPRTRHLDAETLGSFWRSLDVLSPTFRDAYRLMILTGLRRNECLGIQADEIDLKKRMITIPGERTKNGRTHTLPIGPYAAAMLSARMVDEGPVFPGDSVSGHATTTKQSSAKLREYNGYQISPHDLRRTFATLLELTGAPELSIKKLMNHHDARNVTQSYTQISAERLRPIMESVETYVLTLAKGAKE